MFDTIQITPIKKPETVESIMESFKLRDMSNFNESSEEDIIEDIRLYQEAVFTSGKETIKPIRDKLEEIKNKLEEELNKQTESDNDKSKSKDRKIYTFNPRDFWSNKLFKDLEDVIQKTFGFRAVLIQPYVEKYNSKKDEFQSRELNAYTYCIDRYPIDGLVTDNGFYDKTHSIFLDVRFSLGILKMLTPDEMTAVFLHEFGHNIDPALVDIKYTETNILSKYLTDREKKLTNKERKFLDKLGIEPELVFLIIMFMFWLIVNMSIVVKDIFSTLKRLFKGKNKVEEDLINKIRNQVKNDKSLFDRKHSTEAFADNFARMYGYSSPLMSALKKLDDHYTEMLNSRVKREAKRQEYIIQITKSCIKDVHKTNIHRIHSLIKEYEEDLKDPNIPKEVKKDIEEDLNELKEVLKAFTDDKDNFRNKVNKAIYEELSKKDKDKKEEKEDEKKEVKDDNKAAFHESADEYYQEVSLTKYQNISRACAGKQIKLTGNILPCYDLNGLKESGLKFHNSNVITESKAAMEKMQKEMDAITSSERNEFYKIFGHSKECSLAKDKDGYYVRTHRARSKSYENIKDIPKKDVDFVRSTS